VGGKLGDSICLKLSGNHGYLICLLEDSDIPLVCTLSLVYMCVDVFTVDDAFIAVVICAGLIDCFYILCNR